MADLDFFHRYVAEHLSDHPRGAVNEACEFYWPGHKTHPTKYLNSARNLTQAPATLVFVDGNWLTFLSEGETYRRWSHDTDAIAKGIFKLLHQPDASLEYCAEAEFLTFYGSNQYGTYTGKPLHLSEEASECSYEAQLAEGPAEAPADPRSREDALRVALKNGGGFIPSR